MMTAKGVILLCFVVVLVHLIESLDVKKPIDSTEKKKYTSNFSSVNFTQKIKFNSNFAEDCRADLNDCLDHSWAHLPDSPPVGYCCEHYNFVSIFYGQCQPVTSHTMRGSNSGSCLYGP